MTQTDTTAPPAADNVTEALAGVPRDVFLGGRWVPAADRNRIPVVNPATEEVLTEVADAGEQDARAALEAAQRAQKSTAPTS
jgi:succinate-semialdehyde dehydrogenase/glutarate-semialdehyde dehydrogenase